MSAEQDAWESTIRRVLRRVYVRHDAELTQRDLPKYTEAEQEDVLDKRWADFEADYKALCATAQYAHNAAVDRVHSRLHIAENVDHEMIDQAIEYAEPYRRGR